jgi:hypothetical protein
MHLEKFTTPRTAYKEWISSSDTRLVVGDDRGTSRGLHKTAEVVVRISRAQTGHGHVQAVLLTSRTEQSLH